MVIHVISPDGKRHGPFRDSRAVANFCKTKWPDKKCGDPEEEEGVLSVVVDQPTFKA